MVAFIYLAPFCGYFIMQKSIDIGCSYPLFGYCANNTRYVGINTVQLTGNMGDGPIPDCIMEPQFYNYRYRLTPIIIS